NGTSGWATSGSAAPATARYVRVTANVNNVALFLLPVIGIANTATVQAAAVAGLSLLGTSASSPLTQGLFPYSPIAHSDGATAAAVYASDPTHNCGFTPGEQYTLKWPNNPKTSNICSGDADQRWLNKQLGATSEHGEIMLQSASALAAVVDG